MLILSRVFVIFTIKKKHPMKSHPILDPRYDFSQYCRVDLSVTNPELGDALKDAQSCQSFLDGILRRNQKEIAFGGYLEHRGLYDGFRHFNANPSEKREYHLGLDLWAPAGTSVHTPWAGRLHSWANREIPGDYGPVVILEHEIQGEPLYSLFGHLSTATLEGLYPGKVFLAGERFGFLGNPHENGGYAPHVHFQLIRELEGSQGDYPGVCSLDRLEYYRENCPNPLEVLGYGI